MILSIWYRNYSIKISISLAFDRFVPCGADLPSQITTIRFYPSNCHVLSRIPSQNTSSSSSNHRRHHHNKNKKPPSVPGWLELPKTHAENNSSTHSAHNSRLLLMTSLTCLTSTNFLTSCIWEPTSSLTVTKKNRPHRPFHKGLISIILWC